MNDLLYSVEFPQPNRPLSINEANRLHWATKKRRLDPWGPSLVLAWRIAGHKVVEPVPVIIEVVFSFAKGARRDPHNYTSTVVKKLVDTLVRDCHLVPDDIGAWVTVLDPVLEVNNTDTCTLNIYRRPQ